MTLNAKLLLRQAVAIHEQLKVDGSQNAHVELPEATWRDSELLTRQISLARRRGWLLAAVAICGICALSSCEKHSDAERVEKTLQFLAGNAPSTLEAGIADELKKATLDSLKQPHLVGAGLLLIGDGVCIVRGFWES